MKFHFAKVQDVVGFATENAKGGEDVRVLERALLTSDAPEFYQYSAHISSLFLVPAKVLIDTVYRFLVVIHADLSTDLYVNDFSVAVEIIPKKDVKAGDLVMHGDIADVRRVKFPDIDINETDRVIYCFKVFWRFGLFFDLAPRIKPAEALQPVHVEKLDLESATNSIGELYRYLMFYHLYKSLESGPQFEEILKDGWFPFIEIASNEYKQLAEAYESKFNFEDRVASVVNAFGPDRIKMLADKWWRKDVFSRKRSLIEAGVAAYVENTQAGFVNCIKTLSSEIEGVLRMLYFSETGKGDDVKSTELIRHIIDKVKKKAGSDMSLLLPMEFLRYLQEVLFAGFSVEAGKIPMSRHTSSHGVAETELYTKAHALQLILVLDQICYYI